MVQENSLDLRLICLFLVLHQSNLHFFNELNPLYIFFSWFVYSDYRYIYSVAIVLVLYCEIQYHAVLYFES